MMTRQSLALTDVEIRRMPGFPSGGFSVPGLTPGINILYGPNGVGKSTTTRAIEALLWPATAPERASIIGCWSLQESAWRVEIDSGHVARQREGAEAEPPSLPPVQNRDRYRLALQDLLAADNRSFAEEILRESAGGYDVQAAASELGFRSKPSAPQKLVDAFRAARQKVREVAAQQRNLFVEEDGLQDLLRRREAAHNARKHVEEIREAIGYHDLRAREAAAREALDAFPSWMESLHGSEGKTLDDIDSRLKALERDVTREWTARRDAQQKRAAARLPRNGVDQATLLLLEERARALRELERSIERTDSELAARRAQRAAAARRLGDFRDAEAAGHLDVAMLEALAGLARQAEQVRGARTAADALRAWCGSVERPENLERLRTAVTLLQRWLAAPPVTSPGSAGQRLAASIAAGLALGEAALLAWQFHGAWSLLALGSAGILISVWWPRAIADRRADVRDEFLRLDCTVPDEWAEPAVERHLIALREELATAAFQQEKSLFRDACIAREQDADRQAEELRARHAELRERCGVALFASERDEAVLWTLATRLFEWQQADTAAAASQGDREQLGREHALLLSGINQTLSSLGVDAVQDGTAAEVIATDLQRRQQEHATADRDLERATNALRERTLREVGRLRGERAGLLRQLGVAASDEQDLRDSLSVLETYWAARQNLALAERERRHAEAHLVSNTFRLTPLEELQERLAIAIQEAEKWDDLNEAIIRVNTRVGDVKQGADLEEALASMREASDRFCEAQERDRDALLGHVLAQHLAKASREIERPRVFHRAKGLLTRITGGRYRLDVEDGQQPAFRAVDELTGIGHALHELSSGTRLQLLLAVRVAFVEEQEAGVQLPLQLDEVLANSDDQRARAIIESILQLAQEGRQVLYFTAQYDEVLKWRAILQEAGIPAPRVIDLAEQRGWDALDQLPRRELPPLLPEVLAPDGMSHAEYGGALNVPRINPGVADLGSTHLWHLLEDPAELYPLLRLGLSSWGPLRNLVECGGDFHVPPVTFRKCQAVARVLETICRSWRVGRGRPIDRAVLLDSGAVSDVFIDRVAELAGTVGGCAEQLLENLEAKKVQGFRREAIDRLRPYLTENDYLPEEQPLSREAIWSAALATATKDVEAEVISLEHVRRLFESVPA